MKKYVEYMDGVSVSDTLHQRLLALESYQKRPAWMKYGAMAAALLLVCGLGAWGIRQGMHTGHGLPYIEYGDAEGISLKIALDQVLGEGFTEGPVTREEIAALLGGEDVLSVHLDWDGYDVSGWLYRRADGSPGLLMVNGYAGPLDRFAFSVMDGRLPPTCIAYPESVTQEIRGLTITADGHDSAAGPEGGAAASTRRVSFMKDNCGYRFEMSSADPEAAEELVSRLVARIADKGLALDALTADGAEPAHPWEADPSCNAP